MKKKDMHLGASHQIFKYASKLRKNETPAEKRLWLYLKDKQMEGEKFRRQHPFKKFVADFYCYKLRFAIELDGEYHSNSLQKFYDEDRDDILEQEKITILRFSNNVIMNEIDLTLEIIRSKIQYLQNERQNNI